MLLRIEMFLRIKRLEIRKKNMNKITMLGTGNATVSQIYNTCFILETSTTKLLVVETESSRNCAR